VAKAGAEAKFQALKAKEKSYRLMPKQKEKANAKNPK
jgi:hypothetical protein